MRRIAATVGALCLAGTVLTVSAAAQAESDIPGSSPEQATQTLRAAAIAEEAPSGLQVVVDERGRISHSVDATGTVQAASTVSPIKPVGAELRRATLFVASTGFSGPATGELLLDGTNVPLNDGVASFIQSANYWADVTTLVRSKTELAASGPIDFEIAETNARSIDGAILSLIWNDPSTLQDRSVVLLFGAQQTSGDEFVLQMAQPLNPTQPESILEMSLGITFGYQTGDSYQYSTVDVNGQRLTSSAGGEDDGESANGALITVGGAGDTPTNPDDPFGAPTSPRDDDELYDLSSYVRTGDTQITIATANPSNDDNVFFAAFTTNPPVDTVITPGGSGEWWVALGDSFSSGEGAEWFDEGTNTSLNECRRSDAYASLANQTLGNPFSADRFFFAACSGARIPDFMTDRQYPSSPEGVHGGKPQLQYLQDRRAGVVTMTLGGNDMGFSNVVGACAGTAILDSGKGTVWDIGYLNSLDRNARASDWRALAATCDRYNNKTLGSFAVGVEQNIRSKKEALIEVYRSTRDAAPNAKIFVVGYPVFIPGENTATPSCGGLVGLNGQERTWLRTLIQSANQVIREAVAESGTGAQFVDVEQVVETIGSSDGHNHLICAEDPYWHGASVGGDNPAHNRFHPMRNAHVEIAARLAVCYRDSSQCDPPKPWKICDGQIANIYGTGGADSIRGLDTAHRDVIVALGDNDTVNGLNGNDVICGGDGNDRLYGGGGGDRLFGEAGDDLTDGGNQNDHCDGGPGSDRHADCEARVGFP